MRYFKAIIQTILLVLVPLIIIPSLQWYKRTFCEPNTDLGYIHILTAFISIGMLVLAIISWICAINDTDFKEL